MAPIVQTNGSHVTPKPAVRKAEPETAPANESAQSTPEPKRPFWQTESCPTWCTIGDRGVNPHSDGDAHDDRNHLAFGDAIELTLYDGNPNALEGYQAFPAAFVSAEQHYRAAEPTVRITVPTHPKPGDAHWEYGETDLNMTLAEARELRDSLSELIGRLTADQSADAAGHAAWCVDHAANLPFGEMCYGPEQTVSALDMCIASRPPMTMSVQTIQGADEPPTVSLMRGRGQVLDVDVDGAERVARALLAQVEMIRAQESK